MYEDFDLVRGHFCKPEAVSSGENVLIVDHTASTHGLSGSGCDNGHLPGEFTQLGVLTADNSVVLILKPADCQNTILINIRTDFLGEHMQ